MGRKRGAILVTFTVLIAIFFFAYSGVGDNGEFSVRGRDLEIHEPIRINSDAELESIAQQEGWDGDGSFFNPYRISYYEIDGKNGDGIYIGNTTKWININHCHIYNASGIQSHYYVGAGIELHNVENVVIAFNNISDNRYGVFTYSHCANVSLSYNEFYNNQNQVIRFYFYATHMDIVGNTIKSATYGIYIEYSITDVRIENNGIYNIWRDSIHINGEPGYCNRNKILSNRIKNSGEDGIEITGVNEGCRVENNTIEDSGRYGILLQNVAYLILANNSIVNSSSYGIVVRGANNIIYNNTIVYNNGATNSYDSGHVQAYNNGTNKWDYNGHGNYWSDWTAPDSNGDGIVDNPYVLDGNGKDNYPLVNPPVPIPELWNVIPFLVLAVYLLIFSRRRLE